MLSDAVLAVNSLDSTLISMIHVSGLMLGSFRSAHSVVFIVHPVCGVVFMCHPVCVGQCWRVHWEVLMTPLNISHTQRLTSAITRYNKPVLLSVCLP